MTSNIMSEEQYNEFLKADTKEALANMIKADIRRRFLEPEASRLCQQIDDAAILADLLEYMAKEIRKQ